MGDILCKKSGIKSALSKRLCCFYLLFASVCNAKSFVIAFLFLFCLLFSVFGWADKTFLLCFIYYCSRRTWPVLNMTFFLGMCFRDNNGGFKQACGVFLCNTENIISAQPRRLWPLTLAEWWHTMMGCHL